MVKLLIGHKGSGKTKKMIDMANSGLNTVKGSIVFINKNSRLMYDLKYQIRVVCMEDFEQIKNVARIRQSLGSGMVNILSQQVKP